MESGGISEAVRGWESQVSKVTSGSVSWEPVLTTFSWSIAHVRISELFWIQATLIDFIFLQAIQKMGATMQVQ